MNVRAVVSFGLVMALALPASAQEAQANELRSQSRAALADGRFEQAYRFVREAAELSAGAPVWLEVAELADRLRLDALSLRAYQTYLQRSPRDAENRVEIEARIRLLEHHLQGGGYALSQDERAVEALVDWNGGTARPPRQGNVLVDWNGHPQVRERSPSQVALAAWDDTAQPGEPALIPSSRILGPRSPQSLGRALATP